MENSVTYCVYSSKNDDEKFVSLGVRTMFLNIEGFIFCVLYKWKIYVYANIFNVCMYVFEKGFLHVVYNLCGPISCLYLLSIRVATVYYHSKKSSFML